MESAPNAGMPGDVLVVEDDPIISLYFEDTILGFGARTVRLEVLSVTEPKGKENAVLLYKEL